jgi:Outer membrane protein beta-barrel domain
MRKLMSVLFLTTIFGAATFAQGPDAQQQPAKDPSASGYDAYRGRAEVFVSAFGLFGSQANGNGIGEQATQAGGGSAGYRFHLGRSSSLEGRYGFSRNSQKFSLGNTVSSVSAYFSEISGSYVYSFATTRRIQPFLEGGGGVVLFSPGNYGSTASIYGGSGSATSLPTQAKGMFVYGGGADIATASHLYLRLEFRDLGYKTPDFGNPLYRSNTFSFAYEPSIGLAYRF